jgi:hypothetical protein
MSTGNCILCTASGASGRLVGAPPPHAKLTCGQLILPQQVSHELVRLPMFVSTMGHVACMCVCFAKAVGSTRDHRQLTRAIRCALAMHPESGSRVPIAPVDKPTHGPHAR